MTTTTWSPKDPQDVRDYWLTFDGLLATGETITAATVTLAADQFEPSGSYIDMTVDDHDHTDTMVRIRVSGGVPGPAGYAIDYHVTTSTGQQFDVTKYLQVKERTA